MVVSFDPKPIEVSRLLVIVLELRNRVVVFLARIWLEILLFRGIVMTRVIGMELGLTQTTAPSP